jgi:cation diffusion facilitator family transporter
LATTYSDKNVFRIQLFAVVVGVLLLVVKFAAYFYTNSNTILTDALESIINVLAGFFALYSLHLASKPKDFDHPYGHGKVEFISAGFEGIMIVMAGVLIVIKSAYSFFTPPQLEHLNTGMVIIIVSGVVNYGLGYVLVRVGNSNNSMTLKGDGQHLKSDAYSSFGIFVGLILIVTTGLAVLDSIVAVVFGFIIIYMGVRLARKSVAGIMDEADTGVIESIVDNINAKRKPQWIDIHNLRVIQFGSRLHVDCHITLPWYDTLEVAHNEMEEVAAIVNEQHGQRVEFFIHGDPCVPKSCAICQLSECKVRKHPFKGKIEWNSNLVRRNHKHDESLLG